ncbi:MAG: antibiotic biosynthesis monooxygenase [Nocardiopsaceae bacterium]|jgi:quinol monooxygenase YgiN|nr:antibiotic biosynthesis monooxygenase [Nocardiopsaceae bacterium]
MVIVAGHLIVAAEQRVAYLADAKPVVEAARAADGCLDFSLSADLVDPARILVFERWESPQAVEAFRGGGPSGDQAAAILGGSVTQYEVASTHPLM